jgi:hypothetical protein
VACDLAAMIAGRPEQRISRILEKATMAATASTHNPANQPLRRAALSYARLALCKTRSSEN